MDAAAGLRHRQAVRDPSSPPAADADLSRLADAFVDRAQDLSLRSKWLSLLQEPRRLLDVGCGVGALLELQAQQGREGLGLDAGPVAVAAVLAKGLQARCGDAASLLEDPAGLGAPFDGAAMLHVVEHLDPSRALALLTAVFHSLRPGGLLLVATPNVKSHIVMSEVFWLDPTHVRPYPRLLLERLGQAAGFAVRSSFDEPLSRPRRGLLRRLLACCRSLLSGVDKSGPMDSVVVFCRE